MSEKSTKSWTDPAIYQLHSTKAQHHVLAAQYLLQEIDALTLLEEETIEELEKLKAERDHLGEYDASASAIIKLTDKMLLLSQLLRIVIHAHLAVERAR